MKLTVKLTLCLLAIIAVVLAVNTAVRYSEELSLFRSNRAEEHQRVGMAVARMLVGVYSYEGLAEARSVLDEAAKRSQPIHLRWICQDSDTIPCPRLRELALDDSDDDTPLLADTVGERYVTYVPLRSDAGQWLGALELSESTARERRFASRVFTNVAVTMLAVGAACVIASFALGTWLVGRPIERLVRQARTIGEGSLTHIEMFRKDDELGRLSREMDRTVDRLRESHEHAAREHAAREEAMRKLHHSDRLSTVGKLASGLAHELGTPLNVLVLNAGLLRSEKGLSAFASESVDAIATASERMTRLVSTLLAFARKPAVNKVQIDLREVVGTTSGMLGPLAQSRGLGLCSDMPELPMLCDGDPLALSQALANLVVNALDASPHGADVTLSGSIHDDTVRIAVRDRGPGVPAALRSTIFEPFVTTKDVGEGTGLGLSIAYEIATAHGGTIELSQPGAGTVFTLSVPRSSKGFVS